MKLKQFLVLSFSSSKVLKTSLCAVFWLLMIINRKSLPWLKPRHSSHNFIRKYKTATRTLWLSKYAVQQGRMTLWVLWRWRRRWRGGDGVEGDLRVRRGRGRRGFRRLRHLGKLHQRVLEAEPGRGEHLQVVIGAGGVCAWRPGSLASTWKQRFVRLLIFYFGPKLDYVSASLLYCGKTWKSGPNQQFVSAL